MTYLPNMLVNIVPREITTVTVKKTTITLLIIGPFQLKFHA